MFFDLKFIGLSKVKEGIPCKYIESMKGFVLEFFKYFRLAIFANHPVHQISYDWPLKGVLFCICHNNICIFHNDFVFVTSHE